MKRSIGLVFILTGILAVSAAAQRSPRQVVLLDLVKKLAEQNFESVRLNRMNVEQAKLSRDIASAARLPKINLTAAYYHVSEVGGIDLQLPGFFPRRITFGDGNIYETAITASFPVFTGFRLSLAEMIQQESQDIAGYAMNGSIIELQHNVTSFYRLAQLARSGIAILVQQAEYISESLRMRTKLFEQGQALAFDTLQLSTRLMQIHVDRASAMNQYDKAILQLMQLSGLTNEFDVQTDFVMRSDLESLSLAELTNLAYNSRYEIQSLETTKKIHDLSAKSAGAAYYPSIYAQASYNYGRPGVDQVKNKWMNYYIAGVRLEWNLFSWGADRINIEKQIIEKQKTELREEQLKNQIRTQIAILLNDLVVMRNTLSLVNEQIKQENLKKDLVQARYREGLATSTEVLDAESSHRAARLKYEQTKIEYSMKLTELAAAVGREF